MIYVEGGTFMMGKLANDRRLMHDKETPIHKVNLSNYFIAETQVTQELWETIMGSNPSYFTGDNQCPVESVSWNDCQMFIKKLNELTGKSFTLPTEAQWEYAAKGGNKSKGTIFAGSNNIDDVAWHRKLINRTHPVKTKNPNELGIYDMSGNVWEWCADWFGIYEKFEQVDPVGPSYGSERVQRGGSWSGLLGFEHCRVSNRSSRNPDIRNYSYGVRLALRI